MRGSLRVLRDAGIGISLFIDPDRDQIRASVDVGAQIVELHTGDYCETSGEEQRRELARLQVAATDSFQFGLKVAAGHGLDYQNTCAVARIQEIEELNIGHSIVCRALFVGFERAVADMITLMAKSRGEARG